MFLMENEAQLNNSSPQPNPFIAADVYGTTQVNSAHTNAFTAPIPTGTFKIDLTSENQVLSGVVNVATIASANANYMWAISTDRFTYINVSDGNFTPTRNFFNYPEGYSFPVEKHREALKHNYTSIEAIQKSVFSAYGSNPEQRLNKGTVAVCDKNNDVFINYGTQVACLDYNGGFRRSLNVSEFVPKPTDIVGVGITYDGRLVFASQTYIGVVERTFEKPPQIYFFEQNETCNNSFCIDENNGIYIATNKQMRKLVWTGQELSDETADGAWSADYKTGKSGAASTPSLLGFDKSRDKLVVVVDGENNLVAFWRNELPTENAPRIADEQKLSFAGNEQKPVFKAGLAIHNNGVFVANNSLYANTGDAIVDAIATGIVPAAQGCERFEWQNDTRKFKSIFANSSISTATMKPAVSTTSNIVCVNGYYPASGWEVTGLDWNTGEIVHRSVFGKNNYGNAAFATLQYFDNGDMLFNSIAGPCRIRMTE